MSSFIDNGVWDKNGSCIECGFIPFDITDKCFACNPPTNISDNVKDNCDEDEYDIEYAEEEPVTWEINREKIKIIDEDKSSYDDMFESLQKHNERGDTESIHIMEDQIYRRFIKDVALKKFININTIFETGKKIKEIIIDPNDGAWDSCRWYA